MQRKHPLLLLRQKRGYFLMNYLSFVYVIIVVVNYFNTQPSVAADYDSGT